MRGGGVVTGTMETVAKVLLALAIVAVLTAVAVIVKALGFVGG